MRLSLSSSQPCVVLCLPLCRLLIPRKTSQETSLYLPGLGEGREGEAAGDQQMLSLSLSLSVVPPGLVAGLAVNMYDVKPAFPPCGVY